MASIVRVRLPAASTSAGGAATIVSTEHVTGYVVAIKYVHDGTNPYTDNATATFTGKDSGIAIDTETLATAANDFTHAPRMATHDLAGAAALYAAAGTAVRDKVPLANE